jgi:PiT family inorganic phosphate transporter
VFNMLGPLLLGTAVADTVGRIVTIGHSAAIQVIGAGLLAAVAWNVLTWWRGLPSGSGHALVGGLVGAGVGAGRRRWQHIHWTVVREMGVAWLTTIPATAALAAPLVAGWRWLG